MVTAHDLVGWLIFQYVSRDKWPSIFVVCWSLWNNRNKVFWKGRFGHDRAVLACGLSALFGWLSAKERVDSVCSTSEF